VALFSGPPGTGKTLAAEVLAGELGLDLYAIDLSQVVSKFIGETEKNLARVFDAAESSNAVLFFDEADALFGARSEVRDAHDRYANIEVGYLLQRMETYSGLAVLATNLQRNIDDAFLRRMRFVIAFPLPDEDCRRRIWETTWPDDAPAAGLDWTDLAARFDVSGATIRDAAVSAAFLAAADGRVATMTHVEEAMRREYTKLGRVPPELSRPMASAAMTRATGR
jgi:SpoVK/Ycf46/Vps4 family AAA+-type ATPase